jgi:hypothetical protein
MLALEKKLRKFPVSIDIIFIAHGMCRTSERISYKDLVGSSEGMTPKGPRRRQDNIEMDIKGI